MKKLLGFVVFFLLLGSVIVLSVVHGTKNTHVLSSQDTAAHWFLLHRKSNVEFLYFGAPGDREKSKLIKQFRVKTGILGERPTPLPKLLGREYWLVTAKASTDNPETAPFFITLNIPAPTGFPYGPSPYKECDGPSSARGSGGAQQCDWVLPGEFGLHGVNGDETRLGKDNPGSSGCIRHTDEDITYLYNLLDPTKEEIRYYIEDK